MRDKSFCLRSRCLALLKVILTLLLAACVGLSSAQDDTPLVRVAHSADSALINTVTNHSNSIGTNTTLALVTDSDGDGVPDNVDNCKDTPPGAPVSLSGCPLDSDGDKVPDYLDQCQGTLFGIPVDEQGCRFGEDKGYTPFFCNE